MLLRQLQRGEVLSLPHSRPMPVIGSRCHELRVNDGDSTWRIVYRLDPDAVVIGEVFRKTTPRTPRQVIEDCRRRLRQYELASREEA
jgi:phage-related protein